MTPLGSASSLIWLANRAPLQLVGSVGSSLHSGKAATAGRTYLLSALATAEKSELVDAISTKAVSDAVGKHHG